MQQGHSILGEKEMSVLCQGRRFHWRAGLGVLLLGLALTPAPAGAVQPDAQALTLTAETTSEEPGAASMPSNAPAPEILAQRENAGVSLQDLAITKNRYRVDWLTGKIANGSQKFLNFVSARVAYLDADGNTLAEEYKKLLKKEDFTFNAALEPGYTRGFAVCLNEAPNIYQDAVVDVFRVRTSLREEYTVPLEAKLGLGVGWPYGGAGFNAEVLLADYFAVSGGLGSVTGLETLIGTDDATWSSPANAYLLGWELGTRLYFGDPTSPVRGRLGFFFGTARTFASPVLSGIREVVLGYHPGLGLQWRLFKNVSLDFDVEYVIPAEHSRDYATTTYSYGYYPGYVYTYHVELTNYVSAAFGITVHFGGYNRVFEDVKDPRRLHTSR
jgi:hypothetical protein